MDLGGWEQMSQGPRLLHVCVCVCLQTCMGTLNSFTHIEDTRPTYLWVFEQRVLALANRSAHSSSCSPVSFPCQILRLSTGQERRHHFTWTPAYLITCFSSLSLLSLSHSSFIVSWEPPHSLASSLHRLEPLLPPSPLTACLLTD